MFGLSKLPSYEHDVTDPDFSSPDDDDAEATAAKINAIVGSHPDLFGREAPYGANVTIRGLSPRQREQDEVRALGGGRPGKYSLPDIAAGRLPTAR
jgi:hypothetical protein